MTKFKTIAILFFVILLLGCGPKKVHTVKIEAEANQIIDVLGENGVRAWKEEKGEGEQKSFEIMVESDDAVASAIQVMEDNCLGRPEPPEPEGGPVITPLEVERAREKRRTKMNIESQLRNLPGVVCVTVNFVPPEDKALSLKPYPSTASVSVFYKTPTFPFTREEIATSVARSIPDLQPENVSVVIAQRAPRPLRENVSPYNVQRIVLISGIGFATVMAFVAVAFVMRRKRRNAVLEAAEAVDPAGSVEPRPPTPPALLDDDYGDDDDDEDDEPVPPASR